MGLLKKVFVFSEKSADLAELCGGGRQLGETVAAIVIGSREDADKVAKAGAGQVFWLGKTAAAGMLEDYTPTIAALLAQERPELLLVRATQRTKLIAGRLAATAGTSVLANVLELSVLDTGIRGLRRMYGGAALRSEIAHAQTVIATVGAGAFPAPQPQGTCEGVVTAVAFIEPQVRVKCVETRPRKGESVNLAVAKRVVAVGRGLEKQENLPAVAALAAALDAELGCSRPVAEGEKWLARERYIGVSGVMLKPDLYIGVGVSGQIQHMVGANQARVIFAINKDKNAPIFKQADYGLVGDLHKVVPALTAKFRADRG